MAIDYIEQVSKRSNYQLANLWEFFIDDNEEMKFHVTSTSIPQTKLSVEERNTGEKLYSGYEHESGFSIEIRETTDFKAYNYFKSWMDEVYDPVRRVFKLNPPTKTASLVYLGYTSDGEIPLEFRIKDITKAMGFDSLTRKEVINRLNRTFGTRTDKVTTKEIIQNIFTMFRQRAINLQNNVRDIFGGQRIQPTPPIREQIENIGSFQITDRRDQFIRQIVQQVNQRVFRERIERFREEERKVFTFHNVRILGLSDIDADYSNTEALTLSVDMIADFVTTEGLSSPPVAS